MLEVKLRNMENDVVYEKVKDKKILNNGKEKEEQQLPWYKYITAEPPMFCYMLAYMSTSVVEQTFYLFQACSVNHGYSRDICYNISSYPDINKEVQVTVTKFQQWFNFSSHVIPLCLAFFLGAWSDKRGRKIVLLGGILGKLYFSFMLTINTMNNWPVEYVIYTAAFPSTLTGADLAIFAACFAYVADVSSVKNRTLRIGILDVVYLSTMPTGVALGNFLYTKVFNRSFTYMFMVNTGLMVLAAVTTLTCLDWHTRPEHRSMRQAGVTNPLRDFFELDNVKKSFRTLCKKRSNKRRMFLWFLLLAMAFYTFQRDERPMMYLYTTVAFQWDTSAFSHFRTYLSSMYVLLMLLGIPVMTKLLRWRDTFVVMLGASAHICGHLIYAHATTGNMFYVGATAAALGPCVAPLIRSMTSKILVPAERGVAYAFLSVMENLVGLFASIIYSQIYSATLGTDYLNAIFYLTMTTQALVFLFALLIELFLRGRPLESTVEQEEQQISTSS